LSAVRWDRNVVTVHNQIRSLIPWPGTVTYLGEKSLKITEARPMSFNCSDATPGTVLDVTSEGVVVACGEGCLLLTGLQCPGRKPLPVDEFLRGFRIAPGDKLRS
jgi:methionyl-tRNA formyltransferase